MTRAREKKSNILVFDETIVRGEISETPGTGKMQMASLTFLPAREKMQSQGQRHSHAHETDTEESGDAKTLHYYCDLRRTLAYVNYASVHRGTRRYT